MEKFVQSQKGILGKIVQMLEKMKETLQTEVNEEK